MTVGLTEERVREIFREADMTTQNVRFVSAILAFLLFVASLIMLIINIDQAVWTWLVIGSFPTACILALIWVCEESDKLYRKEFPNHDNHEWHTQFRCNKWASNRHDFNLGDRDCAARHKEHCQGTEGCLRLRRPEPRLVGGSMMTYPTVEKLE